MIVCISLLSCAVRSYCDTAQTSNERELVAVLEWEILWSQTPDGFRMPTGPVPFAMNSSANSVSYCSHALRACEKYETYGYRPWKEVSRQKCEGKERDEDCLLSFLGAAGIRSKTAPTRLTLGPGGLSGMPQAGSGIISTGTITLRPQHVVQDAYRSLHPQQLSSLVDWLRATTLTTAGYTSITIACFSPSDPEISLYGERKSNGPILISVFWDREVGQWQVAGFLEGEQNASLWNSFQSLLTLFRAQQSPFSDTRSR